jgi:hypothetical protein
MVVVQHELQPYAKGGSCIKYDTSQHGVLLDVVSANTMCAGWYHERAQPGRYLWAAPVRKTCLN